MSSTDRRELILARLEVALAGVSGVKTVYRNRLDIPESKRPAVVILDADETVASTAPEGRGRAGGPPPMVMEMTPEIYLLAGPQRSDENVGTLINTLRINLIRAVLSDDSLLSLCKDGDINYLGFATGLAFGRSMEAEAGLQFAFRYFMHPDRI